MFKDFNFDCIDGTENYTFEIIKGEIVISLDTEKYTEFDIIYDENIYEKVKIVNKVKSKRISKGRIKVSEIKDQILTVKVKPNYKFFVKSCYKFINRFINKQELIEEINIFKESKVGGRFKKDLDSLIINIENKDVAKVLFESNIEGDRVDLLIFTNKLYNKLAAKMKFKDLMLLVTQYISAPRPPKVNQNIFDCLARSAILYEDKSMHLWRLAMNYDSGSYDFRIIEEFLISIRDTKYLVEYLSSVIHINQDKIIDMVIETNDKEFIESLVKDKYIKTNLEKKLFNKLKKALK